MTQHTAKKRPSNLVNFCDLNENPFIGISLLDFCGSRIDNYQALGSGKGFGKIFLAQVDRFYKASYASIPDAFQSVYFKEKGG